MYPYPGLSNSFPYCPAGHPWKPNSANRTYTWTASSMTGLRTLQSRPNLAQQTSARSPPPRVGTHCYGMAASSREQKIKGKSNPRQNVQGHIHSYVISLSNAPPFSSTTVICKGGHWHWQVGQMPDTDLIPDLRSKGVKYHTFSKTKGKDRALYRDLCRSLTITSARDWLLHFQWKQTLRPIPQLFLRSKVLTVGGVTCVHMSIRNCPQCPGAGEGRSLFCLLKTKWTMAPGMFPTLRHRFRDHTLRQFLPKLKIMDKDIGLALYRNRCRSQSLGIVAM
jgi:hypothetical protein